MNKSFPRLKRGAIFALVAQILSVEAGAQPPTECEASKPVIAALWPTVYQQQHVSDEPLAATPDRIKNAIWSGETPPEGLVSKLVSAPPRTFRGCLDYSETFREALERQKVYRDGRSSKIIDGGSELNVNIPVIDQTGLHAVVLIASAGPYWGGYVRIYYLKPRAGAWRVAGHATIEYT